MAERYIGRSAVRAALAGDAGDASVPRGRDVLASRDYLVATIAEPEPGWLTTLAHA